MANQGLKYGTVVLTCSATTNASGPWVDCSRFRGGVWVIAAHSDVTTVSVVSCTVTIEGTLTATVGTAAVITGTRGIRLGSLILTAASLTAMTCLLLSTVQGDLVPGAEASVLPRYMRMTIGTYDSGNPVLIVGGLMEAEKVGP